MVITSKMVRRGNGLMKKVIRGQIAQGSAAHTRRVGPSVQVSIHGRLTASATASRPKRRTSASNTGLSKRYSVVAHNGNRFDKPYW